MYTTVILAQPRGPRLRADAVYVARDGLGTGSVRDPRKSWITTVRFGAGTPLFRPRSGRALLFFGQAKGEKETWGTVHYGDESVKKNWSSSL